MLVSMSPQPCALPTACPLATAQPCSASLSTDTQGVRSAQHWLGVVFSLIFFFNFFLIFNFRFLPLFYFSALPGPWR